MNGVGVLIVVFAILAVIMIHEAGHFLAAKLFDFKATKFFLGFGPTLWSFRRGETEYGVKAIPAGGFVKIVGMNPYEEVPAEDAARSYPNKPRWQRAIVLLAGPATHWAVAFLLLVVTLMTIGIQTDQPTNQVNAISVRTQGSTERTAAAEAGIRPDDRIVAIDGRRTDEWEEISSFIRTHPDEEATLTIERDGQERTVDVHFGTAIFNRAGDVVAYAAPGDDVREPRPGEEVAGFLGVEPAVYYDKKGFFGATAEAGKLVGEWTVASFVGIGRIFATVFNGDLLREVTSSGEREITPDSAVGIVGFVQLAGDIFALGRLFDLMSLIAQFTIFVGLMNLLPLPPLDGGHLAVVGYEAVTGERVDVRRLIPLAAAVIAFFLVLFVAVLYLDLFRPLARG
ncbi:MAG TPA: site-2 protease family protein [Actinomycetota bacterium]|nr:site-2 protease family protein [Actinomycetota bacterium]